MRNETRIFELLTEGKKVDRAKHFVKKSNYLYQYKNEYGEGQEWVIINDLLIESD